MNTLEHTKTIADRDLEVVWHPFTQMQLADPPISIVKGEGVWLETDDGRRILDAVSSWWVNTHGHAHPYLADAVYRQFNTLEHSIFAGFTHPKAVELSERVLALLPGDMGRVFFSDNGSTAVEVGIKMALQYWHNQGEARTTIVAFEDAYHGDTFGAMSVSGRSKFTEPFFPFLFDVAFIPAPTPGREEESRNALKAILAENKVAAFIFEPLCQAAGGMKIYTPEALDSLMGLVKENGGLCIADEVFTGFGRTGTLFATEQTEHKADIMALSKGLTGGSMALGLTVCHERIYNAFLSDDRYKAFFHGHSFTGNAIACAVACASLDLFEQEQSKSDRKRLAAAQRRFADSLQGHEAVEDVRCLGTIIAMDVKSGGETSYFNAIRDEIYTHFLGKDLLLRPLGNVLYFLPPYCISAEEITLVHQEIKAFLDSRCG